MDAISKPKAPSVSPPKFPNFPSEVLLPTTPIDVHSLEAGRYPNWANPLLIPMPVIGANNGVPALSFPGESGSFSSLFFWGVCVKPVVFLLYQKPLDTCPGSAHGRGSQKRSKIRDEALDLPMGNLT